MNVYDAAIARIKLTLDRFDLVYVSFSGGKDSGVLLNLAIECAQETGQINKLAVFHIDYEAQYQATTKYVDETLDRCGALGLKMWRVCLPLRVPCCTRVRASGETVQDRRRGSRWCARSRARCSTTPAAGNTAAEKRIDGCAPAYEHRRHC